MRSGSGNIADLVALTRCQRNGQVGVEVYIVASLQRGICLAVYSALDRNGTARSGLNRYLRLFHKGCREDSVCGDCSNLHLLFTVHLAGIRCTGVSSAPIRLYIRCNIIIARRCGYGCLRTGVDIFCAVFLFRLYLFIFQRVCYAERADFRRFRRCNCYRRLRPNHHVDRSCRGQAVDGVGEGFAVADCRYLVTVYLPAYDLIRGRLFIGKSDAAVGRATVATLNFCTVCGILCGQRAASCNGWVLLIYDTERYLCRRCAVVDQCAYPDIALQIANRVAQSGSARVAPVAVWLGLVLPAGNAHCGGRLRGQRNRRALFALAFGQTGRFKAQSNNLVRIFLVYSGIVYGELCRLLKGYTDRRIRGDGQLQLVAAENSAVRVLLGFGCVCSAFDRPLLYNIAGLRRCGKGNLGAAEHVTSCQNAAYCSSDSAVTVIAQCRYRVELVGEFNLYIQSTIQTGNGQRLFIIGEGVVISAFRHFNTVHRPFPNLIVFFRRSGENHIAAAGDLGTAVKGGRIIALITLQCAVVTIGVGYRVGICLHKHHGAFQRRRVLGEEFRLLVGKFGNAFIVNHADIVYTGGLIGRHTLCLEQVCIIITNYKTWISILVRKGNLTILRRGSRNRDRLFAYGDILAGQQLIVCCSGNAIGARNQRFTGFPVCHCDSRANLVGGVGDGLVCTGSTAGAVANRYALEARRNRFAISAVAHLNLIEIVCRLGIVGDCAAARSRRLAVAAENRHNAVNARLARCPAVGDLGVSGGFAYLLARHAAGGRVRDFKGDRAVGCGAGVRDIHVGGQRNGLALYLLLAAGDRNLRCYGSAGLEQLAFAVLIQPRHQRQAGVGVSILRVVGAVPLVDGERSRSLVFRSIGKNRIVALGHINGRQAVFTIGIGSIADGVRCCHFSGRTIAIFAIILVILTIQRQCFRFS